MFEAGSPGVAESRMCDTATSDTPDRSLMVSNGMVVRRLGLITCAVITMPMV